jgi:hypothetical protein
MILCYINKICCDSLHDTVFKIEISLVLQKFHYQQLTCDYKPNFKVY